MDRRTINGGRWQLSIVPFLLLVRFRTLKRCPFGGIWQRSYSTRQKVCVHLARPALKSRFYHSTLYILPPTMPPRAPLSAISGNRQHGHELTLNLRGQLEGALLSGASLGAVSKIFKIGRLTV